MSEKSKRLFSGRKRRPLTLLLWAVMVVALGITLSVSLSSLSARAGEEQLTQLRNSVRHAVVSCYAIEGRYPASLSYLEQHYGLVLQKDKFVYHYQNLGDNLMPEIAVFALHEVEGE